MLKICGKGEGEKAKQHPHKRQAHWMVKDDVLSVQMKVTLPPEVKQIGAFTFSRSPTHYCSKTKTALLQIVNQNIFVSPNNKGVKLLRLRLATGQIK